MRWGHTASPESACDRCTRVGRQRPKNVLSGHQHSQLSEIAREIKRTARREKNNCETRTPGTKGVVARRQVERVKWGRRLPVRCEGCSGAAVHSVRSQGSNVCSAEPNNGEQLCERSRGTTQSACAAPTTCESGPTNARARPSASRRRRRSHRVEEPLILIFANLTLFNCLAIFLLALLDTE